MNCSYFSSLQNGKVHFPIRRFGFDTIINFLNLNIRHIGQDVNIRKEKGNPSVSGETDVVVTENIQGKNSRR